MELHSYFVSRSSAQDNGCIEWSLFCLPRTAKRFPYGQATFKKKKWKAHRLSWTLHFGEIPKGMYVCHSCDNPKCINPDHLFLGTPQSNMDDMIEKGRKNVGRSRKVPKDLPVKDWDDAKRLAVEYGVSPFTTWRNRLK